ncbi:MAG: methionyl-tRNA formyltransferase [Bacteroidia bacterium]
MRIGIIGRGEWTFLSMIALYKAGYNISFIVTAKEAPEYKFKAVDFEKFANENNIPFLNYAKINKQKLLQLCNNLPEIVISVNYSGIIEKEVIDLFPIGILNAHGGDLPKYRGNACQAWAIINGEEKIGLCIHKMIGGELDSGPIITRSYFPLSENTRIGEVYDWMESEIPKLMQQAVECLILNPEFVLEVQSTDPKDALRCYPRKPEDGKIDWTKSAIEILRLINASSEPFSGAYTFLENQLIRIWRAELYIDEEIYLAIPGQVSEILPNGEVIIISGNGKLIIKEISLDNYFERILPSYFIKSIRKRLN